MIGAKRGFCSVSWVEELIRDDAGSWILILSFCASRQTRLRTPSSTLSTARSFNSCVLPVWLHSQEEAGADAVYSQIEDFNMVQFLPLDVTDEDSIGIVLSHIDNAIQCVPSSLSQTRRTKFVSDALDTASMRSPRSPKTLVAGHRLLGASELIVFALLQMDEGDFDVGE